MNSDNSSRFIWDENDVSVLTNADMLCADCRFIIENNETACEIYEMKPNYVINNEKKCPEFKTRQ